jgi:chromosomal replication initiator protein
VAEQFGVTVDELKGSGRSARLARPRQVGILLLHEEAGLSRSHIGRLLGGRDHSTIAYGLKRITTLLDADAELRRRVRMVREELRVPVATNR